MDKWVELVSEWSVMNGATLSSLINILLILNGEIKLFVCTEMNQIES